MGKSTRLQYKHSLWSLMKWYFSLDHYNYSRWFTIHSYDLFSPEFTCPAIHDEFVLGNFAFPKTNITFSRMAPGQLHERNNKKIKGAGGAVHLMNREDESGLLK